MMKQTLIKVKKIIKNQHSSQFNKNLCIMPSALAS